MSTHSLLVRDLRPWAELAPTDFLTIFHALQELSRVSAHSLLVRDLRPWAELAPEGDPSHTHSHHQGHSSHRRSQHKRLEVALQSIYVMQEESVRASVWVSVCAKV